MNRYYFVFTLPFAIVLRHRYKKLILNIVNKQLSLEYTERSTIYYKQKIA